MGWASEFGSAHLPPNYKTIEELRKLTFYEQLDIFNTNNIWSRTLWYYMRDEFVEVTRDLGGLLPEMLDIDIIRHVFHDMKFIYLYRKDKLRQVISLIKANQSEQWMLHPNSLKSDIEYTFEFDYIKERIEFFTKVDREWVEWFDRRRIEYLPIEYEVLEKNPKDILAVTMGYLGNDSDIDEQAMHFHTNDAPHATKRQSDSITEEWVKRFEGGK